MSERITWVALDTSKKRHAVAVLDPGAKEPRESLVLNEPKALRRLARKLVREAPAEVRICYEAGPCGYALQRQLEGSAELVCEVIAPSLVPVRPGEELARQQMSGALFQQFGRAAMAASKPLESKAQNVRLTSGTLQTEDEVTSWIAVTEKELLNKLKDGPLVIA